MPPLSQLLRQEPDGSVYIGDIAMNSVDNKVVHSSEP